jgi:hypothetical protein
LRIFYLFHHFRELKELREISKNQQGHISQLINHVDNYLKKFNNLFKLTQLSTAINELNRVVGQQTDRLTKLENSERPSNYSNNQEITPDPNILNKISNLESQFNELKSSFNQAKTKVLITKIFFFFWLIIKIN